MRVEELRRELRRELEPEYGRYEAEAMTELIFRHLKGWDRTQLLSNGDLPVSERMLSATGRILSRLAKHEPLQYILGDARFYGMDLHVAPGVLIPRPETAELVDRIVDRNRDRSDLRVLDVGCGSGAVSVALARNLPFSRVTGLDVSPEAISIARGNAEALKANVDFVQADIFTWQGEPDSFDIVVSNPPYIAEFEKKDMEANVLEYEPEQALFVPDDDPLRFYRRICEVARNVLAPGGQLWFEINPLYAVQMRQLMTDTGFADVETCLDSYGKVRFAYGIKK